MYRTCAGCRENVVLAAGLATMMMAGAAGAAVINVPADQPTIQDAINVAVSGADEVVIATGTYFEAIDFLGKTITVRSASGVAADVIIDGGGIGPVVTMAAGESISTVLRDVTITGGDTGNGGIFISNSQPTIAGCVIRDNLDRGVTVVSAGSVFLRNTSVLNNSTCCSGGGLMLSLDSSAFIEGCLFAGNSADLGGAILSDGGQNILASRFEGNTALEGSALHLGVGTTTMTNCVVFDNTGTGTTGAAIHMVNASTLSMINGTVVNNTGVVTGGLEEDGFASVVNSIFWGNVPRQLTQNVSLIVQFTDVERGWLGLENIAAEPQFIDVATGNFRLRENSPAINAGAAIGVAQPALDFDGDPRVQECRVDMGAFESNLFTDCNNNGISDGCDINEPSHQIDDGMMDAMSGFGTLGHIWAVQYSGGVGTIVEAIAVALNSSLSLGDPITVWVWNDPNNDGDPSDAALLTSQAWNITVSATNNPADGVIERFEIVPITPTRLVGSFFVGVSSISGGSPLSLDQTTPLAGRSFAGPGLGTKVIRAASAVVGGNLMVRAHRSRDGNGNGIADECECSADIDLDGFVGVFDFLDVLVGWSSAPPQPADVTFDGIVGIEDFLRVLSDWGPCN